MGIRLSDAELRRLARAQEVLLASLEYSSRDAWALDAIQATKEFVGCDIGSFVAVLDGRPVGVTHDFDPALFDVFSSFDADDLDYARALSGALADARYVFTAAENLARYTGRKLEDTRVYQEFMSPAGVRDGASVQVPIRHGAAVLAMAHSIARRAKRGYARETQMLSLLVPAFEAGARMITEVDGLRQDLRHAIDTIPMPIGIRGARGEDLGHNSALEDLLRSDPDSASILQRISAVAQSMTALERSGKGVPTGPHCICRSTLATAWATYRMSTGLVGPGLLTPTRSVLVAVEQLSPSLPPIETLRETRGLSRREGEVVLLLARGASNKAIGRELGIRPSTVRTLVTRAFEKLGVHSRKALALELIQR